MSNIENLPSKIIFAINTITYTDTNTGARGMEYPLPFLTNC